MGGKMKQPSAAVTARGAAGAAAAASGAAGAGAAASGAAGAYECADRALVSKWLQTGRTLYISTLNEPVHKEKYTREEATKLYNVFMTQTVRRVPKYWFMEQDEFDPLLNELWLSRKIFEMLQSC
jgi:hypothetical protein